MNWCWNCYNEENINVDHYEEDLGHANSNQANLDNDLEKNSLGKANLEKSHNHKSDFIQKDNNSELFKSNTEFDVYTELPKIPERERYESPSSPPKTNKNYSNMKK